MRNASELYKFARDKHLGWKRMSYLLQTKGFRDAWGRANRHDRQAVEHHVLDGNISSVKDWITQVTPIEKLSLRNLRKLAQRRGVYNYSRKSRKELVNDLST